MILKSWVKQDERYLERMRVLVELGRRRDRILESPRLDVEALEELVKDYEEAGMVCAAASLRRRLEWYRRKAEG
jgi:hypothetical protein